MLMQTPTVSFSLKSVREGTYSVSRYIGGCAGNMVSRPHWPRYNDQKRIVLFYTPTCSLRTDLNLDGLRTGLTTIRHSCVDSDFFTPLSFRRKSVGEVRGMAGEARVIGGLTYHHHKRKRKEEKGIIVKVLDPH